MTCCLPYTQPFTDAPTVSIIYSSILRSKYGAAPLVEVYYYDDSYNEYIKNPFPGVRISAGVINVDNGGPATGFVKIS